MVPGEVNPRWLPSSRLLEANAHPGFDSMQVGQPFVGNSRFQASTSQRNRAHLKKPPEPLRRAVASCLSGNHHPSSEAARTLQDYLSNPSTVDVAYAVLLEHANAERERSPPVVARCVSLLKRYLFRYVPKPAMLQQVDTFCAVLIAECNSTNNASINSHFVQGINDARYANWSSSSQGITKSAFASSTLVKSLAYVRSLVACYLPSNLLQSTRIAEISRSQILHAAYGSSMNRAPSDVKDTDKATTIYGSEENFDYLANDVLKWRWIHSKHQHCWTPSPVMTDSGGISRPHVRQLYEFSDMGAGMLFLKNNELQMQRQHMAGERKSHLDSIDDQLIRPSKVTSIDSGSAPSHLRAITASKRQKSQPQQGWDSDAPKSTWRRRPRPLFRYKHYSEQQPLRLNKAEMEEIISAFCVEGVMVGGNSPGIVPLLPVAPSGRVSVETADVAGSILIKLIIDMYLEDSVMAAPLTFSLIEGMLKSPVIAIRRRCFDLLLNLGVHAHLLEPIQIGQSAIEEGEPPPNMDGVASFLSATRGLNLEEAFRAEERLEQLRPQEESRTFKEPITNVDIGTPEAVKSFELWLLKIVFEMLLFLVQAREKEETVWVAALSTLLYFVCECGKVQRERLCGIDIRVLKSLLDISWENSWANELHGTLICMMSNLLYKMEGPSDVSSRRKVVFDVEQLDLLGGIEFVCLEYARAKSSEDKTNLFCVVVDYVLIQVNTKLSLHGRPNLSDDDVQAVVGALCLAEAAESFGFALRHGLKNVGKGLFKAISSAMSRDIESGRLDSSLLEDVTSILDSLVSTFILPDEEFSEMISITMANEGSQVVTDPPVVPSFDSNAIHQAWSTLHTLLHSSNVYCQYQGYSWLVDLLYNEFTRNITMLNAVSPQSLLHPSRSTEASAVSQMILNDFTHTYSALHMFYSLLRSKHASVRRGFIMVLERLLVKCQQTAVNSTLKQSMEAEPSQGEYSVTIKEWENKILEIMSGALWQFVSANDSNHINILQMCNVMLSQLCVMFTSSSLGNTSNTFTKDNVVLNKSNSYRNFSGRTLSHLLGTGKGDNKSDKTEIKDSSELIMLSKKIPRSKSLASMLLNGQAAAPRLLISRIPTDLLYWPLLQLAGAATEDMALAVAVGSQGRGKVVGGTSDVRAALLVLLIGKCSAQQSAFTEVGGEEFFRSLLDDMDARVAYYTASFLLKRMMSEEPEKYQQVLHTLVFRAQQCNNEKLLENPYLQMRGILQLSNDGSNHLAFPET